MDALFALALSGLLAHELDAVHRREWRLLFVLRRMEEDRARRWFIALHVPLVAAILWAVGSPHEAVRHAAMLSLDAFMVVHAGMHARLSGHPIYEFRGTLSNGLIYGTAVVATIHLVGSLL